MEIVEFGLLAIYGAGASVYGSIIGAGGGFLIVPMLFLFYSYSPAVVAGTSLAVVCFNALSSAYTYAGQKRIDYRAGIAWAITSFPGSIAGAFIVQYFNRRLFGLIFGLLLLTVSVYLLFYGSPRNARFSGKTLDRKTGSGWVYREGVDARGVPLKYQYNMWHGMVLSFGVGFISSMVGIGGGIINVPVMISLFGIPVHISTATSQFILLFSSIVGTASHFAQNDIVWWLCFPMALGAIIGGRVGAKLSQRLKGQLIIQGLSLALAIVALRLLFG